jgi:hypothetical protein
MIVDAANPYHSPVFPCRSGDCRRSRPVVSSSKLAAIRIAAASESQLKKYLLKKKERVIQ